MNNYYKNCNVKERLLFAKIESDRVFKIIKNFDESKAPDIDNLSGILLKDGASLITTPITQLCNIYVMGSKRACQGKPWLSHFKINGMLKSLYRKNRYLMSYLKQRLCNALIQPHFNYACSAWYRNLNKKFKSKYKLSKTEVLDTVSSYINEVTLE